MIGPLGYPYPSSPAVDKDILRYTNQEYTKLYDAFQDFVIRDGYNYKRIEDFGAKPETGFDNTAAFAEAVEWANAETNPAGLIFGPGIWEYDESPNWAVDNFQILANGAVRLRYSGTDDAFIIDGGAAGAGITNMFVGRFLIEAHDGAGDGVYIRAVHRSFFSFNVRGCGTTQAALRTEWCVIDEFQFTTSVNEGGWYNDGSGAAKPLYGAYLDKRGAGETTSYCTFLNPIIEGTGTGCLIQDGIGNNFYGGTMEACTNIGLDIGSASLWNKCYGADFEANTNHDIYIQGDNNHINGSDTLDLITVISGAKNNQITGGSHSSITIDSGSIGTSLSGLTINRFGDASVLTDNGTDTQCSLVYDYGNEKFLNCDKYKVASSITVQTGGTPVGTITDLQTAFDGNEYNLPEVTGSPGFDLEVDFTNVKRIKGLVVAGRYVGGGTHYTDVSFYDYNAAADVPIFRMQTESGPPITTNEYRTILIPDDSNFIDGSGNVQISFIHPVSGNASHDLYIDYIALLT